MIRLLLGIAGIGLFLVGAVVGLVELLADKPLWMIFMVVGAGLVAAVGLTETNGRF